MSFQGTMAIQIYQVKMSRETLWLTEITWTALPQTHSSWEVSVWVVTVFLFSAPGLFKSISDVLLLAAKVSGIVIGERSTEHTNLKDQITCSEEIAAQKGIQVLITKHLAIRGWLVLITVVLIKYIGIILLLLLSLPWLKSELKAP